MKMKILKRREFGDPLLRKQARTLSNDEVLSEDTQTLIKNMRHTLIDIELGVALAAPQVGESVQLVVVAVRPTEHRKNVEPFDLVMINPEIIETFGKRTSMWEGCISSGKDGKAGLFAKVPRFKKVKVKYFDQQGEEHEDVFEELQAQIAQHEIGHLNGELFVDLVKDTKTYMTYDEYVKRVKKTI